MVNETISVVIPVFNGERFLAECLDSIVSQEYEPLEILLVDDGSTDNTALLAQSHPAGVRYIHQSNQGYASAVNTGLAQASGSLLAILDADDLWAPDKLSLQASVLHANPDIGLVIGNFSRFWVDDAGRKHHLPADKSMNFGASLFRAEILAKVGPVNTDLAVHADFDWFMRARELDVGIHNHDEVVLYYRRHADNVSGNVDDSVANQAMMEMLRKSLQRRRQSNKDGSLKSMVVDEPVRGDDSDE